MSTETLWATALEDLPAHHAAALSDARTALTDLEASETPAQVWEAVRSRKRAATGATRVCLTRAVALLHTLIRQVPQP